MDKMVLNNLRNRDFLKYEDNFAKIKHIDSELRVGFYWEKAPIITVVIPVYRRPELAQIALNSILCQSFKDFQVILVDDEATGEVVNPIEKIIIELNNPHVIYFKNKQNLGLYANWNRCVSLCRSKWVCMVHTDTFLKENYLETVLNVLDQNPEISFLATSKDDVELACCEDLNFDSLHKGCNSKEVKLARISYFDYNFAMKSCIQGSVFSKEHFEKLGGIKSDGSIVEDFPFMAKYAYYYGISYDYRKLWVDCLYDNFGGNPLIWQEQLVYIYYLYKFISEQRPKIIRKLYCKKAVETIYNEALTYKNGTSWIKKQCNIDMQQLMEDCQINVVKPLNNMERFVLKVADRIQRILHRRTMSK